MVSGQVVEGQYRATAPSADPNPSRRRILAPAIRDPPHVREQFGEGDGRDRDAPRERSEPIDDSSLRRRPEDLRDHVRIEDDQDRKSTRLNSSHVAISYAVFCLKKKNKKIYQDHQYNMQKLPK